MASQPFLANIVCCPCRCLKWAFGRNKISYYELTEDAFNSNDESGYELPSVVGRRLHPTSYPSRDPTQKSLPPKFTTSTGESISVELRNFDERPTTIGNNGRSRRKTVSISATSDNGDTSPDTPKLGLTTLVYSVEMSLLKGSSSDMEQLRNRGKLVSGGLRFVGDCFTVSDLRRVMMAIRHCPEHDLISLEFENNKMRDEHVSVICQFLRGNSFIKRLSIQNNPLISDQSLILVSEVTASAPRLESLSLSNNEQISNRGLSSLAQSLASSSLQHLDISRCPLIDDKGVTGLVRAVERDPTTMLSILNLADNSISTTGAQSLASWIRQPTTLLKSLDISRNRLEEKALDVLIEAMLGSPTLAQLAVTGNSYPDAISRLQTQFSERLISKSKHVVW